MKAKFYINRVGTILLLSVAVLMLTNVGSCSSRDMENLMKFDMESISTNRMDAKSEALIKQYDFLGQEHNRVLKEVFAELDSRGYDNIAKIRSNKSKAEAIVMESAERLLHSYQYILEENGASSLAAEKTILQAIEKIRDNQFFFKSLNDDIGYTFSPNQKEVLTLMDNILYKKPNPREVFNEMDGIAIKVARSFPEQELQVMLGMASVAKYSYQFWYDYFDMESQIQTRGWDWEHILGLAIADVMGAVVAIAEFWWMSVVCPVVFYGIVICSSAFHSAMSFLGYM